MRQDSAFFIAVEDLVRLVNIHMVIRVPLEFEEEVVWDDLRSIPWVPQIDGLVDSLLVLLPHKAIMFNVVSVLCQQLNYKRIGQLNKNSLLSKEEVDEAEVQNVAYCKGNHSVWKGVNWLLLLFQSLALASPGLWIVFILTFSEVLEERFIEWGCRSVSRRA